MVVIIISFISYEILHQLQLLNGSPLGYGDLALRRPVLSG